MAPPLDFPGFRAQRSMLMLSEDPAMTLEELIENTYATEVEFAIRILDDLIGAARQGGAEANRAAEVLAAWNRRVDAGSRGALLFVAWIQALEETTGLGNFLFATAWSAEAPLDTPHGLADPDAAVAALELAAEQVEAAYGRSMSPGGTSTGCTLARSISRPAEALATQPGSFGFWTLLRCRMGVWFLWPATPT